MNFHLVLLDLDNNLLRTEDLEEFRGGKNVGVRTDEYKRGLLNKAKRERRILIPEDVIISIRKKHPGVKIGVFTASPRFYAETLIAYYYPSTMWDMVVAFEDVQNTKPYADGINLARNIANVKYVDRTVLIGDSWKDVVSAYRAGCWCVLFRAGWPQKWGFEEFRALDYLPDAVADEAVAIEAILESPLAYLPLLERCVQYDGIPPLVPDQGMHTITHFNKFDAQSTNESVQVVTLGRMFAEYREFSPRREWHLPTIDIHEHKEAHHFPSAWVLAVRSAIYGFVNNFRSSEDIRLVVTVIPCKPSRLPRLELFLNQLAQNHKNDPLEKNADIAFDSSVLSYGVEAKSHHTGYLSAQERFFNVRNNLTVSKPNAVFRRWVVVIDDVVTSGATMFYAEKYLLAAGASGVICLALAQTVKP